MWKWGENPILQILNAGHTFPLWLTPVRDHFSHPNNNQEFWKGSLRRQWLKQRHCQGVELDFLTGITWPCSFEPLHRFAWVYVTVCNEPEIVWGTKGQFIGFSWLVKSNRATSGFLVPGAYVTRGSNEGKAGVRLAGRGACSPRWRWNEAQGHMLGYHLSRKVIVK